LTLSTPDKFLEEAEGLKYPLLFLPFHGQLVPVKLQELNQAQIMACGEFSLINIFNDGHKKIRKKDIIEYAEMQSSIAKMALVSPTYDQIMAKIGNNPAHGEIKKTLVELKEKLTLVKRGPGRTLLEEEITNLRIKVDLIMPDDFLASITAYSLGLHKSDIKMVSRKMLIEAAALATRGHDNPADHLDGRFSAFNIADINKQAWLIFDEQSGKQRRN
jgi:hypothetical protein